MQNNHIVGINLLLGLIALCGGCSQSAGTSGLPACGPSQLWTSENVHRYRNDEIGLEVAFLGPSIIGKEPRHPEDADQNLVSVVTPVGIWIFSQREGESTWYHEFFPSEAHWRDTAADLGISEYIDDATWRSIEEMYGFPPLRDTDGDGLWDRMALFGTEFVLEFKADQKE